MNNTKTTNRNSKNIQLKSFRIFAILTFLLLLQNCSDNRIIKIDKLLIKLNKQGTFNGNILIAEKGEIIYEKSFGLASIEAKRPLTSKSLFNIASISKTFTALSIMILVEKGLLDINEDINIYFPDFPYKNITIENLLTHTSGLYRIQSKLIRDEIDQKGLDNSQLIKVYNEVKPKPYFEAGTAYKYANTNYILLALIIEKVSNLSFETFLKQNIFEKAGLYNTFLRKRRIPYEQQKQIVSYYRKPKWLTNNFENINTLAVDKAEQLTFKNNYGPSAIYTTTGDLLKYHIALQNGKLINSKSLEKMYSPFTLMNSVNYVINSKSNYPAFSGLSWRIAKDNSSGKMVFHSGGFRGGRNFFIRNISKDQCVIVLTNNDLTDRHSFTTPMRILNNQPYQLDKASLAKAFSHEYVANGIKPAFEKYKEFENDNNYIPFIDWDFEEIGSELIEKNDINAAINLYQLYTDKYPGSSDSWNVLAKAYFLNGNSSQSLINLKKSLQIDPNQPEVIKMIDEME